MKKVDLVVVGGGHAGIEAATAAARMGLKVSLITFDKSNCGVMSCNPAIGGIGKGHLVKEIDALDGVMGLAADRAGIQFKVLNISKGPAVRGPRCQADRGLYKQAELEILSKYHDLDVVYSAVTGLLVADGKCKGVVITGGKIIHSGAVVLTTGTFLNGKIHIGFKRISAGRINEAPSVSLASSLNTLGLPMSRLKTGAPPRILASSVK